MQYPYTPAQVALAVDADKDSVLRYMTVQDALEARDVTLAEIYMEAVEDQERRYGEERFASDHSGHVEEDPKNIG